MLWAIVPKEFWQLGRLLPFAGKSSEALDAAHRIVPVGAIASDDKAYPLNQAHISQKHDIKRHSRGQIMYNKSAFGNRQKLTRIKACTTDQAAIDMRLGQQSAGIFGLHGTAIYYAKRMAVLMA